MIKINVTIAEAANTDKSFFIDAHHMAYRGVIEEMFGWNAALQRDYATAAFDSGNIHLIWLATLKIGVIGLDVKHDHVWLKQLFILPDYQRKGVGSFAVNWAIEIANRVGKDLRLQTLKANTGAKIFYQERGFKLEEETELHWVLSRPSDTHRSHREHSGSSPIL